MRKPQHRFLRLLRKDKRGVAAIEFALIFSILVMMLFASFDVILMLSANRKVSVTADTLSDLTARLSGDNNDANVRELLDLGEMILGNFANAKTKLEVLQLKVNPDRQTATVENGFANDNNPSLSRGKNVALPSPLNPGDHVILSNVSTVYQFNFGVLDFVLGGDGNVRGITISDKAFFRTRNGGPVI